MINLLRRALIVFKFLVTIASFGLLPSFATAQAWPQDKPIKIIVPYPSGGSTDTVTRLIAQHLAMKLSRAVIVENVAGASGNIGAARVVHSPADGHTLLTAAVPLVTNPAFFKDMPFDVVRDLSPITLVTLQPYVLEVNPSLEAKTLPELISLAKAKPGKLTFASHGAGGATHLAAEWFKQLAGIDVLHVPYKGQAPALVDLLAGHVDMMFDNVGTAIQYGPTGKIRALATTGTGRAPLVLDGALPAMSELKGFEKFNVVTWIGFMAPAGTPGSILERLSTEINAVALDPEVSKRLNEMGFDVVTSSPKAFSEQVRRETANWARIVKEAGIPME